MRVIVRLLSILLALALVATGLLLALEVAWHWIFPDKSPLLLPWRGWQESLAQTSWDSTPIMVTAGLVALFGLILLLFSASAKTRSVRMHDPANEVSVTTSPRSLARLVGHQVRSENNVSGASVTANSRKVRVRAHSKLEAEQDLRPRVRGAVTGVLEDLPLVRSPKVSVVVDSPKDRR